MKLDLSGCDFRMEEGKFLGYMSMKEGIKANPEKLRAIHWGTRPEGLEQDFILGGMKNNHRKKTSIDIGTISMSESDGTLNDATPRSKEVVSPSVVDDTMEKEKLSHVVTITELYPPLPMQVAPSAGNAPGKSLYANVTGKPSGKKLNFPTLFTLGGNGIDVVVLVESIRTIYE
ncbi:hypothetical protein Tco_0883173 [Tanacetum coccineum]